MLSRPADRHARIAECRQSGVKIASGFFLSSWLGLEVRSPVLR